MVQLPQIITANASALFLMLILKLHMKTHIGGKKLLDTRILNIMVDLTMIQCILDTLVFWVDGQTFEGADVLNWVGNIVYYILNGLIAYFWPLFAEYRISGSHERVRRQAVLYAIPIAVCSVIFATAPLNGIVFTIGEGNIYQRNEVFFALPLVLVFLYVFSGTMNVYLNRRKNGKYMIFPAIYFVSPLLLAMTIQAFNYGISVIFIGIAIGLMGVYMSTQNESAYIDQLCGVFNRRYYNDYIRSFCSSGRKGGTLTGALIDMDDFKLINDRFGHNAGDEALKLFAKTLRSGMNDAGFAVRYGGDEFVLISEQSEQAVVKVIESVESEIRGINASGEHEFLLGFSYGMATISSDGDADRFFSEMDSNMYKMKNKRKAGR